LVDPEVFHRRLARLEQLLRELRMIAAEGASSYRDDERMQLATERCLHLAIECCLDMANHLIADRGWRTPTTSRESFQILREEGVLTAEQASGMEAWAGLRNVLVHLYMEVDRELLLRVVNEDLDDLEGYAAAVAAAAGTTSG
jgi:uncharacterized protein YutE (UPF0331/DUF86 family)